jgi:hypothetical protein
MPCSRNRLRGPPVFGINWATLQGALCTPEMVSYLMVSYLMVSYRFRFRDWSRVGRFLEVRTATE